VRACTVVVACVVLHNLCLRAGDREPPDDLLIIAGRRVFEEVPAVPNNAQRVAGATAARTALIDTYFANI
jgi:hypothetical protein